MKFAIEKCANEGCPATFATLRGARQHSTRYCKHGVAAEGNGDDMLFEADLEYDGAADDVDLYDGGIDVGDDDGGGDDDVEDVFFEETPRWFVFVVVVVCSVLWCVI